MAERFWTTPESERATPPRFKRRVLAKESFVTFFLAHEATLKEFEMAMAGLDQPVEACLSQLNSIQTHDTRSRLNRITAPTLVLAGADDILLNLARELHAIIPGAEWAISKAGHAFLWEHPAPFNQAVLAFIGKHRGPFKQLGSQDNLHLPVSISEFFRGPLNAPDFR